MLREEADPAGWSPVLDACPSGILLVDSGGAVLRQNPAAHALQQRLALAGAGWPWGFSPEAGEARAWVDGSRLVARRLPAAAGGWWVILDVRPALGVGAEEVVLVLGEDGGVLSASPAAREAGLALGPEGLLGRLRPHDRAEVLAALAAGDGQEVGFFLHPGEGEPRYLAGRIRDRRAEPEIGAMVLACREEGRLHQAEQHLRELERRFVRLLEGIPAAVVLVGVRQEVHYINHRARHLLEEWRLPARDLPGWLWQGGGLCCGGTGEPYPPERLPTRRALEGESGTVDDVEMVVGGAAVALELSAAPVRDRSGRILYTITTFRVITERRRLEQRLRQSHRMDAIGQVAGELAHDFRNFLTAIVSYGRLALDSLEVDHPAHGDIEEILQIAGRAGALTGQLLTASRQQPLALQRLDLNELLRRTAPLLQRMVGGPVRLEVELEPGLWPVEADPAMMERVLINLALNARDAMPAGGSLVLSTENLLLDEASAAGLGAPGAYAVVSVRDSGEGMTAAVAARIFEPYFTTKPAGQGSGLGLSMVYGVLQQQGGFVQVISAPGEGACFRLALPRHRSAPASAPPPLPALLRGRPPGGSGEEALGLHQIPPGEGTLLLVEDDSDAREAGRRILGGLGYTVEARADAASAWVDLCAAPGRYDLLLLGGELSGEMSGLELARRVLAADASARVLILSGREPVELPTAVRFLARPFTPRALGEAVWRMLRVRP